MTCELQLTQKLYNAEEPVQREEKRLATWGTDAPDDLILDKKKLAEALKKVSITPLPPPFEICGPSVHTVYC